MFRKKSIPVKDVQYDEAYDQLQRTLLEYVDDKIAKGTEFKNTMETLEQVFGFTREQYDNLQEKYKDVLQRQQDIYRKLSMALESRPVNIAEVVDEHSYINLSYKELIIVSIFRNFPLRCISTTHPDGTTNVYFNEYLHKILTKSKRPKILTEFIFTGKEVQNTDISTVEYISHGFNDGVIRRSTDPLMFRLKWYPPDWFEHKEYKNYKE